MPDTAALIEKDLSMIWHPCVQMKQLKETLPPLVIQSAKGPYLTTMDGKTLIDASSSWWCKPIGHQDPRMRAALIEQANCFEHVILANTTHENIVTLGEKLISLTNGQLNRVQFAGDGSAAIEIALKMSIHARYKLGQHHRRHFIALQNAYHGETTGALSVSDLGLYRAPYQPMLMEVKFIHPLPYVLDKTDPLWEDCSEVWPAIEAQLTPYANTATALIVEPILQGASGMRIYSKDLLKRLRAWTKANDVHLICDEILTGLGRTGKPLAMDHAGIVPDMLCLGKNLTAGWLPFSVTLTHDGLYDLFYSHRHQDAFLHSHTFSGNPLGVKLANTFLDIMKKDNLSAKANVLGDKLKASMTTVAKGTGKLENIRQIGAVVAADLITDHNRDKTLLGFNVFKAAVERGALLRPLANTLYWFPPLNCDFHVIDTMADITESAINAAW